MEAKQTSLIDLLERIPQGARLIVEHDQFSSSSYPVGRLCHEAAAALRAALAQEQEQEQAAPVQEPVAWMYPDDYAGILKHQSRAEVFQKAWCNPAVCVPLYTAPPQRPPLTDEEMLGIIDAELEGGSLLDVARAIERKVREKRND